MHLQDYDTTEQFNAKVISSERITPGSTDEVREMVLELGLPDFDADAGQSIGVLAPGLKALGQEHHFRLYTVADLPEKKNGHPHIKLCVKRCNYIDEFSGEEYQGVASNFLCDLHPGDSLTMTGPYGLAFEVPAEPDANLILIGAGTGIAPFRAYVRHLYNKAPDFKGKVLLFHGARSGLDMLYRNDAKDDFTQYYDEGTFEAIAALASRPHWSDDVDWGGALEARSEELAKLLDDAKTYVYVAGLEKIADQLDKVFTQIMGSEQRWARRKAELKAGSRWVELLY